MRKPTLIVNNMNTPESFMLPGFVSLNQARQNFEQAVPLYIARNDSDKGDEYNIQDLKRALKLLADAYDEISAIWENDINV